MKNLKRRTYVSIFAGFTIFFLFLVPKSSKAQVGFPPLWPLPTFYEISQITNNSYYDNASQINDNEWVTWYGYDGNGYVIFLAKRNI